MVKTSELCLKAIESPYEYQLSIFLCSCQWSVRNTKKKKNMSGFHLKWTMLRFVGRSVCWLAGWLVRHTFTFFVNFISASHFRSFKIILCHFKSFLVILSHSKCKSRTRLIGVGLVALNSEQIELQRSAWRHLMAFMKGSPTVTSFLHDLYEKLENMADLFWTR